VVLLEWWDGRYAPNDGVDDGCVDSALAPTAARPCDEEEDLEIDEVVEKAAAADARRDGWIRRSMQMRSVAVVVNNWAKVGCIARSENENSAVTAVAEIRISI